MNSDRRQFIKQTGAMVGSTMLPLISSLSAIAEASAQTATNDYKALVCVFLFGGNDHAHTLIYAKSNDPNCPASYSPKPYAEARPEAFVTTENKIFTPFKDAASISVGCYKNSAGALTAFNAVIRDYTEVRPLVKDVTRKFGLPYIDSANIYQQTKDDGKWHPGEKSKSFTFQINPINNAEVSLSPALLGLHDLYQSGEMAIVVNVGPLHEPTVGILENGKVAYYSDFNKEGTTSKLEAKIPNKLESHNDQQYFWQGLELEGSTTGWGGKIINTTPFNDSKGTSITTFGGSIWGQGPVNSGPSPYAINLIGSMGSSFDWNLFTATPTPATAETQAGYDLGFKRDYENPFEKHLKAIYSDGILTANTLGGKLSIGDFPMLDLLCDSGKTSLESEKSKIAAQLRAVAHIIKEKSKTPGRQVFFVGLSGFDTHGQTAGTHEILLQHVGDAIRTFHETMKDLNCSNKVTTFTASDFGRTLLGNGQGSDHGWGGHHFVVGGAVNGGKFYGQLPAISSTDNSEYPLSHRQTLWDATTPVLSSKDRGRLIPSVSVDQYGATLAKWMGVSDDGLMEIFPNLIRFAHKDSTAKHAELWRRDLGFMKTGV